MGWLKIPMEIEPSLVEEITDKIDPQEVVEDLAALKGNDIFSQHMNENVFVVASDTIVVIDNEILGKPKDRDDARAMLQRLSGREHEVYTSIYMAINLNGDIEKKVFSKCSLVKFTDILDDIMDLYLEGDEALDKAGAYGIQEQGLLFVENLQGCYSNVVGFPLSDFIKEMKILLEKVGVAPQQWRSAFVGS